MEPIVRYVFALTVVSVVVACASTSEPAEKDWNAYPFDPIRFEGPEPRFSAYLAPGDFGVDLPGYYRAILSASNPNDAESSTYFGPCTFGLRFYTSPQLLGDPVWDNRVDGCELPLYWITLGPRETTSRSLVAHFKPDALADTLPAGEYHVAVTWRRAHGSRSQLIPAGRTRIGH